VTDTVRGNTRPTADREPTGAPAPAEADDERRRSILAPAIAVAALLATAVFAVTQLTGGANASGADSPQAAGTALLAAIDDEDVLGVLDVVLPSERDTLRDPTIQLVTELQRLGVLSDDAGVSGAGGGDLELTDRRVVVTPTNAADIADVTVSASTTTDASQLPLGDLVEVDDQPGGTRRFSLPLATVRVDGRWYLSISYSLAERARRELPGAPAIPSVGLRATGADSPAAAVDALLDAIESRDASALIRTLDPHEFGALQRYAPRFIGDLQAWIDGLDATVTIDEPTYRVSGSGTTRAVTFAGLGMTYDIGDRTGTVSLEDGCWSITAGTGGATSCASVDRPADLDDIVPDAAAVNDLVGSVDGAFVDYVDPGIIVTRVDGKWFVSPVTTALQQSVAVARALDRDELDRLMPAAERLVDQLVRAGE